MRAGSVSFRYPYLALLFSLLLCFGLFDIHNIDIFREILSGKTLLQDPGSLFHENLTFTNASYRWVNVEWLFSLILWGVYRGAGVAGLIALRLALLASIVGLVYANARKLAAGEFLPFLAAFFFVLAAYDRFTLRAELFSYLFVEIFLLVLLGRNLSRGRVGALAALQILWVNLHGYFILGPCIACIFLAGTALKRDGAAARRAFLLLILLTGACFVNPNTWRGAVFPFQVLKGLKENRFIRSSIVELNPPFSVQVGEGKQEESLGGRAYIVLGCALAAAVLLNWRRRDAARLLLPGAFFAFSLSMRRNLPLFALVAAPALAGELSALYRAGCLRRLQRHARQFRCAAAGLSALGVFFLFWMVSTDRVYVWEKTTRRFGAGVSQYLYPAAAARFLAEQGVEGEIFNEFGTSGTLLWRLFPEKKVFITENTFRAPFSFYRYYLRVVLGSEDYNDAARKYGIGCFVLRSDSLSREFLIPALYKDPRWKLVYCDERSVIFFRKTPGNEARIRRFGIDLGKREEQEALHPFRAPDVSPVRRRLPPREIPLERLFLGNFYAGLGFLHLAKAEFEKAAAARPDCPYGFQGLGFVALARDDLEEAERQYRRALTLDPADFESNKALGFAFLKKAEARLRNLDLDGFSTAAGQARIYLATARKTAPGDEKVSRLLLGLSASRWEASRLSGNSEAEEKELKLLLEVADTIRGDADASKLVRDARLRLGTLYLEGGKPALAAGELRKVVAEDPEAAEPRVLLFLAGAYWSAGNRDRAAMILTNAVHQWGAKSVKEELQSAAVLAPLLREPEVRVLLQDGS